MKIVTSRFGEIEFPEEVLIEFPEGVLGFPDCRRYILLEHDLENSPFKWLQSSDNTGLAFIVLDPMLLVDKYPVMIDSDTMKMIQAEDASRLAYMSIINVPNDDPIKMSANLKAPLVVNPESRKGRQIIMGSQAFSIQEPVFPRLNDRLPAPNNNNEPSTPSIATA